MTEPFRSTGRGCPRCAGASLSDDDHLACDECHGMLIGADELAGSIHDIDGGTAPIEARDREPASAICPRCGGPMERCTLALGAQAIGGGFLWCDRDGVWMPREVLVAIYAAAGQRRRAETAKPETAYGAVMSSSLQGRGRSGPPQGGGMVAVLQGVESAFRHGGELAISHWETARPRVHTIFVSAHRGERLVCPTCTAQPLAFEGDRWCCPGCRGSFVEDAALVGMLAEMTGRPVELPDSKGAPGARACPVCKAAMRAEDLDGVAIDRCAGHGVWFDDRELETALGHAGTPPRTSWVRRLFGG